MTSSSESKIDSLGTAEFEHADVVARHHRFGEVQYRGTRWDLSHLKPFAIRWALKLGTLEPFPVDVVVLFACHCFTHEIDHDERSREDIPEDEIFSDGRETRVLDLERYEMSRNYLPSLIQELEQRHIQIADPSRPNFFSYEVTDRAGKSTTYAVFFEVQKDAKRKKRLILRVQSAYVVELNKRQRNAKKVTFGKLLSTTYLGTPIKG
jgi:hypothetical protein